MTDTSETTTAADPHHPEVIYVAQHRIGCDGGGGALGHPKVYYSLEDGVAVCEYCGRKFVYDPEKA